MLTKKAGVITNDGFLEDMKFVKYSVKYMVEIQCTVNHVIIIGYNIYRQLILTISRIPRRCMSRFVTMMILPGNER